MDVEERLRLKIVEKKIKKCESKLKKIIRELYFCMEIADTNFLSGLLMWFYRYIYVYGTFVSGAVVMWFTLPNSIIFWIGLLAHGTALLWLIVGYFVSVRNYKYLLKRIGMLSSAKIIYESNLKILKERREMIRGYIDK
ncbi:hypothetical protein [Enterococcus rotai]|uniref:hypothetical protein n=1 Tax=Enterococcus rotai TaxID=118060 RepID=UPI0032B58C81